MHESSGQQRRQGADAFIHILPGNVMYWNNKY